jgi:hypothetical protein
MNNSALFKSKLNDKSVQKTEINQKKKKKEDKLEWCSLKFG